VPIETLEAPLALEVPMVSPFTSNELLPNKSILIGVPTTGVKDAESTEVGTAFGFQFDAVPQEPDVAPVHVVTAASAKGP
jgi:hypothetical protein